MSGPYRFTNQEPARSPLDRQTQNVYRTGQPPSFKTNVNRAKTKKWVEAKPYSYDGDDWGEYDEYDEYNTEQAPPAPPPLPAGQRAGGPSRSFTDPQRQGPPHTGRRNSFEAGDEHRSFSAAMAQPTNAPHGESYATPQAQQTQQAYTDQPYKVPGQQVLRQASGAESDVSDTPQHRRDFSPSALPPPLHTRVSPVPGNITASPANVSFPPPNSNVGPATAANPQEHAPSSTSKPLPFIRPADIYKRLEDERQKERASLDSSRPSLDSVSSRPKEDTSSQGRNAGILAQNANVEKPLQPLEALPERTTELPETSKAPAEVAPAPSLPEVPGISTFGDDFWSSGQQTQGPPVVSPPDEQGLRSVVDQAFVRNDDQRSVPPTPVSKQSDSGVSRSNTDSTSGISPIMSRVPSTATSALKVRNNAGESSTPAIAEEGSETNTPISQPVSTAALGGSYQIPRKPSPSHSRNVSSTSIPRAGLATPSPGESPARSPAVEPQKSLREPESVQLSSLSPTSPETMEGGSAGPSSSYINREADIANAIRVSPDNVAPELRAAEKESRDAFLESHQNTQLPPSDAAPRSRSESPSKGRVQELAGKFGQVSNSRRGSTQSVGSTHSIQSWERSQENSRPSSPTKVDTDRSGGPVEEALNERPAAGRETSFRPALPGQWESYATTVSTPAQSDKGDQLPEGSAITSAGARETSPLGGVDLTPTTPKRPVSATEPSKPLSDPLAALKAAGNAMGDAIQASVGLAPSSPPHEESDLPSHPRSVGDVLLSRPVHLNRTASSVASSVPPTPPAKDTPESESLPSLPSKEKSPEPTSPSTQAQRQTQTPDRSMIVPHLSTDPSEHDEESDRLRKEIVASLSPLRPSTTAETGPNQSSLQTTLPPTTNRESSILPSEYDTYWADDNHASPPSNDLGHNRSQHAGPSVEQPSGPSQPTGSQSADAGKPTLLNRFSWEDTKPQPDSSEQHAQAGVIASPVTSQEQKEARSPTVQRPEETLPTPSHGGLPEPYFGPDHIAATSKPGPVEDAELTVRPPTPPPGSAKRIGSPTRTDTIREVSPVSGLHVVNSTVNPEAIDMPPRLSCEVSPASPQPHESLDQVPQSPKPKDEPNEASPPVAPVSTQAPSTTQEPLIKQSATGKPLDIRDIVTIKSSSERIATYNKTRDYWANVDNGLDEWIASTMAANPELASQPAPPRPAPASLTSRHRATGSISLFLKHSSTNESGAPHAQASPLTPISPLGSAIGVHGRSASHQMQAKGKDLLHTAGVLGGKGMTSAKGLFAKGKSRFRASGSGDKVDK